MTFTRYRSHSKRVFKPSQLNSTGLAGEVLGPGIESSPDLPDQASTQGAAAGWQALIHAFLDLTPLPTAIVCLTSDRILLQNSLVAPLFKGSSPSNTPVESLTSAFYADPTDHRHILTHLEAGECLTNYELQMQRLGGETFDALVSVKAVEYEGIPAALWIWTDVTQQRQTQRLNDLLATAIHHAGDAIEITDAFAQIEYVNPAFATLTGYSELEAIGKTPSSLLRSEQHSPDFYDSIWQTISQGQIWSGCVTSRHKNGSFFNQELTIAPVYNAAAQITHFVTVRRDTTQRQQAEAERQKLVALVENSNDFIAMSSLQGEILYINAAGRNLIGLESLESALGRKISEFLPDEDLAYFCEITLPTLHSQGRHEGEGKLRHLQTGECFEMHRSCFTVRHPQTAEVLCLATVQRNITAQKQAERALRASEEQFKTRARQQAAIAELGQQALAGTDLSTLLNAAVALVAQVLNVELCGILELLPTGDTLELRAGVGWKQGLMGSARIGTQENSQIGYTLRTQTPVMIEDLQGDSRFCHSPLLDGHGVVSSINVVIPGQGQPFGVLGGYTTTPQSFNQTDIYFLQAIANVLATAIERKQTESRLRLMEQAIAASSNGIVLTDARQADNPIIYVNAAFESMTGYTAAEVIGHNCRFLQGTGHKQPALAELRAALKEQRECHVTLYNYRKDGSLFWNELHVAPVFGSGGQLTHFVGIQTNITQRKQAEDALREQEEQYRRIVETATEGIWVLDHHQQTTFVNQQMAHMLGYTPEEMLGETLFSFMDEEGIAIARTGLQRRRQGINEAHDFKFRCKNGKDIWVIISTAAFFDAQGNYAGALGMVTDITDRKRAEAALRKSEEQLRLIFELAPIGMSVNTLDGQFLRVNQAFCQAIGYTADELLNCTFADITHAEDLAIDQDLTQKLLEGELPHFQIEKRYLAKAGRVVNVLLQKTLIRDAEGEPLHIIAQVLDISDRKRMEEQLAYDAFHDALTGLPNRLLFIDRLEHAIARTQEDAQHQFAVLFLDLDRFKVVNDSLGHIVGDQLLVAIAAQLQACIRPGDTIARLGGDEFTILLDSIKSPGDATSVAERIQKALQAPFCLNGHEIFTTASIGIALSDTLTDQSEDLLRKADIALYRAKEQGKARYALFNSDMQDQAVALLRLETDLRWAIERQELRVFYQPIVSLKTGRLTGFEALVRWQHPERGLISPAEFIPIAEETGLIVPLGQWVLWEACQQLRQWQLQFPSMATLSININLSSKQLSQPNLIQQIDQVLQQTGLAPDHLKLEITESGIMENASSAAHLLRQLKVLGVQLCIDDFGTGYSSLSRLHQFPINTLKIDRSFIRTMSQESENVGIVHAIMTLSHNLGMEVVAEGIETEEQVSQLRQLNCESGQGYFFSKPLNHKAAEALIQTEPIWW